MEWQQNPLSNYGIQINVAVQDENGDIILVENLMESNKAVRIFSLEINYVS
jgi:hypothetical protein